MVRDATKKESWLVGYRMSTRPKTLLRINRNLKIRSKGEKGSDLASIYSIQKV